MEGRRKRRKRRKRFVQFDGCWAGQDGGGRGVSLGGVALQFADDVLDPAFGQGTHGGGVEDVAQILGQAAGGLRRIGRWWRWRRLPRLHHRVDGGGRVLRARLALIARFDADGLRQFQSTLADALQVLQRRCRRH